MWSVSNCRASLSAVQIVTSSPRSSPRRARVAITSSASAPSCIRTGTLNPSKTRRMTGIWGLSSSGIAAALGLVVGEELGAEDLPRPVEGGREVVGLAVAEQVDQVAEDPEDGMRRLARRPRHQRDGVEDLIDQGIRIQDVEGGPWLHRGNRSGRAGKDERIRTRRGAGTGGGPHGIDRRLAAPSPRVKEPTASRRPREEGPRRIVVGMVRAEIAGPEVASCRRARLVFV